VLLLRRSDSSRGLDTVPADPITTVTAPTDTTPAVASEPVLPTRMGPYTLYLPACGVAITGEPLGPVTQNLEDMGRGGGSMRGSVGDDQSFVFWLGKDQPLHGTPTEIELDQGAAQVLVEEDVAIVALHGDEPVVGTCNGSLWVEVSGGSAAANRAAAIDLANRSIVGDLTLTLLTLQERSWRVDVAQDIGPDPAQPRPDPISLPVEGLTFDLGPSSLAWSDGCDDLTTDVRWEESATFDGSRLPGFTLAVLDTRSAGIPCPSGAQPNETMRTLLDGGAVTIFASPGATSITLFGGGVQMTVVADG
jgi:hypothetical protein